MQTPTYWDQRRVGSIVTVAVSLREPAQQGACCTVLDVQLAITRNAMSGHAVVRISEKIKDCPPLISKGSRFSRLPRVRAGNCWETHQKHTRLTFPNKAKLNHSLYSVPTFDESRSFIHPFSFPPAPRCSPSFGASPPPPELGRAEVVEVGVEVT